MLESWDMTIKERITKLIDERGYPGSLYVVFPSENEWYDALEMSGEYQILLLPRFHGELAMISEQEMNKMGWYRRE